MTYCIDLHFDYDPIINKETFLKPTENNIYMSMLNLFEVVSPRFLLDTSKLGILFDHNAELFYTRKNNIGILHRDISIGGPESLISQNDYVKINFMFYGSNSLMNWYTEIHPGTAISANSQNTGTPAERFELENVKHVHSCTINYPSLVQVAVPHNITNNLIEDRYVICLVPLLNNKRIPMNIALDIFKPYIK